jgi:hypothetical protein
VQSKKLQAKNSLWLICFQGRDENPV